MISKFSVVMCILLAFNSSGQQDSETSSASLDTMVDTTPADMVEPVQKAEKLETKTETAETVEYAETVDNLEDEIEPVVLVPAPPPTPVPRETVFGTQCDIPFTYKEQLWYNCFWGHDAMEYCKVGGIIYECEPMLFPDQIAKKKREEQTTPVDLEVAERFTVEGIKCSLPKEYNGRLLADCLRVSVVQEICYAAGKWHTCAPLDSDGSPIYPPKPAEQAELANSKSEEGDLKNNRETFLTVQRYTTKGKLCVMPFKYNGEDQYDCVTMPDKKEWCFLEGDWLQCADVGKFINSRNVDQYDMYESGGDDAYTEDGSKDNKSKGNGKTAVIVAVVLGLVVLGAGSFGGFMFIRKAPNTKE